MSLAFFSLRKALAAGVYMSTRFWTVDCIFDTKDSVSSTEIPTFIHTVGIFQADQSISL